jgi:iron(III) transport system permease protein
MRAERLWLAAALSIAVIMLLPLGSLLWTAAQGSAGLWSHLAAHVLPQAAWTTALLLTGVGGLSVVIGTGCAWLVSAYDFPGRRLFGWALLLPLAMPTYIVAFAYLDLLHPLGPVQSALRALLGIDSPRDFRLPDLRSLPGCIALMALVLYPYVYLSARAMFATQAAGLIEAARTLGVGGAALFWRVALPLARPAVAVGAALVLLETLNDIGASEFLGVKTLTVAVYSTWITRSDLPGAAQIALAMLAVVLMLLALERHGRRRQRYASVQRPRPIRAQRLRGARALLATVVCALPVLLGFVAPALSLSVDAWDRLRGAGVSPQLVASAWNTLKIGLLVVVATMVAGLVLAWSLRLGQLARRERVPALALRVGSLGYALPGTVLAIALLTPMAWFDDAAAVLVAALGGAPQALLMGSTAALVLACSLRFLAIASGGIDAGLARIPLSLDQAARSLGAGTGRSLARVHLPLLRPAVAVAAMLVCVDAMKELPATLLLRPLNFDTLATWLYAEAARGTYEEGAVAAWLIVLIGLPAVLVLARAGFAPMTSRHAVSASAASAPIASGAHVPSNESSTS